MSTRTTGRMAPERHAKLMHEALLEFAGAGYDQASLNRIIRACRLSKSSFYHFFPGKEALFEELVLETGRSLFRELEIPAPEMLAGTGMWEALAGIMRRLHALSEAHPDYVAFGRMIYRQDIPAGEGSAVREVRDAASRWLAEILETGQRSGMIRTDLPLSLLVELTFSMLQVMDRWSLQHFAAFSGDDGRQLMRGQVEIIRRMLEPADHPAISD